MNASKNKIILDKDLKNYNFQKPILCYGHFNVIHPGHIRYLEYAKAMGTTLCVVIQSDKELLSNQGDYFFNSDERALNLASLQLVDSVVILDKFDLSKIIKYVKPKSLVLGREFEQAFEEKSSSILNNTAFEIDLIGASIIFHGGDVHYSHSMLGLNVPARQEKELSYVAACKRQKINKTDLLKRIDNFTDSSLLVIGDTILDQYIACEPIGMSAEAPVVVMRELDEDKFLGGAGIVAANVSALGAKCHYLSVVGTEENANIVRKFLNDFKIKSTLLEDPSRPTTFKIRYLVENQKMFRVSRLKEHNLNKAIEKKLIKKVRDLSDHIDGILVCDFLYGVITPAVLDAIKEISREKNIPFYCDLQCSSQLGSILKFSDSNLICPTEREARIGIGAKDDGLEWVANQVLDKTNSKNLVMKLGSDGFIAYESQSNGFVNRQPFPSLSQNPIDVTGAGDSLLAALAVGMSSGASLMESSAVAVCVAAAAVETLGNQPIKLHKLKEKIESLY